jgi:nanoRNase/pAp phosphatase (c-di-AMP/oligoRNAs hydrolase)
MPNPMLQEVFNGNKICIITHRLADVDALCSSYVLSIYFKERNVSEIDLIFPEGLDSAAETIRKFFSIESSDLKEFNSIDLIIVVDTGSPKLLGNYYQLLENASCKKVLIDHHPLTDESKNFYNYYYVDPESSSTCEIVLSLLLSLDFSLTPTVANLLLLGILFDTKHLILANERTIKNVSLLIDKGAKLKWGEEILSQKKDRSEIIAKLKSLSRMNLYELNDSLVAIVKIGSFQASVAKFLVDAGCDIVLAYSFDDIVKGSLRCSDNICKRCDFSLNILAENLAKRFNGIGGGHKCAASFNLSCDNEQLFISTFLSLLETAFSTKMNKIILK